MDLPVDDDPATQPGSQGHAHQVVKPFARPEPSFAKCKTVGIIVLEHREVKSFFHGALHRKPVEGGDIVDQKDLTGGDIHKARHSNSNTCNFACKHLFNSSKQRFHNLAGSPASPGCNLCTVEDFTL